LVETSTATSFCRFCHACCPVEVTLSQGKAIKVAGNPRSPSFWGFCCSRGQALPETLSFPGRLLHSQKREHSARHSSIPVEQVMDEVAARLATIVANHGPDSVAFYLGSSTGFHAASGPVAAAFAAALGSSMIFTSMTIDQPGKAIANALLGRWLAGSQPFAGSDVHLMIGANPVVAIGSGGVPFLNPARRITDELRRGMKMIVIDPRRTETARRAHIHLQPRPGEDAAILAAMIHVILEERLFDEEFVAQNVSGMAALRDAVGRFTPTHAAARADLAARDIAEAARLFARGPRGVAAGSTGANMSGHSSLVEYLIAALNTICGRWIREGEAIPNPGVFLPTARPKAQASGQMPARYPHKRLHGRDLTMTAAGLPTAALADEILVEHAGRVRALFSMGNPVAAWPDQQRTASAMEALDLLVQIDVRMSATAKLASYVIAPKASLEAPGMSMGLETMENMGAAYTIPEPFAIHSPRIVDPPPGSELIEEWEFYYGLAQRMGLQLELGAPQSIFGTPREAGTAAAIDMVNKPTTEDLFVLLCRDGRVPLSEIKAHPNGKVHDFTVRAAPKDPDCTARLDVGNAEMLDELRAQALVASEVAAQGGYPFRLICRRLPSVYNSSGRDIASLQRKRGGAHNAAFMHPADLEALGLRAGSRVEIASASGSIEGFAAPDDMLRRGLVSMAHSFGDAPGRGDPDPRRQGSNTSILVSLDDTPDGLTGMPRMSAIPVAVRKVEGDASPAWGGGVAGQTGFIE
jgi:anaerobic selenocysteine-containing dehydrogenase